MTTAQERTRSVLQTADLLEGLLNATKHPEIKEETRQQIKKVMRHYPNRRAMSLVAEEMPALFGTPKLCPKL